MCEIMVKWDMSLWSGDMYCPPLWWGFRAGTSAPTREHERADMTRKDQPTFGRNLKTVGI